MARVELNLASCRACTQAGAARPTPAPNKPSRSVDPHILLQVP